MRLRTISEAVSDIDGEINDLMNDLESQYDVDLWLQYSKAGDGAIVLSKIVVPKDKREDGIGTKVLNQICKFADEKMINIVLTPSSDFGGSKSRLEKFYKNFGFKKYKGFDYKESMIREPQL